MEIEKVKFVRKQPKVAITFLQGTLTDDDASTAKTFASDIDAIVVGFGLIFFNSDNSSWLSNSDRNQTMAESLSVLTASLEKRERLRFMVTKDELKVNGDNVDFTSHYAKAFVTHLIAFGDVNFTLTKGIDKDEFSKLMIFMCKKPHEIEALGEFTEAMTKQNFAHASSKKILLREVSEEEIVVAKNQFAQASVEEKKQIESDVVSFLSTEKPEKTDEKAANVRKVVEDSSKMSDLIMQAVKKKSADAPMTPEQITGMVVGCMDKAFDALLEDPFSKTQKGKKVLGNALKNLEKELLSKVAAGDKSGNAAKTVTNAVERMNERLTMDSIAQDYAKKLKSLEESEKRILRFIKVQGLDRIKDADLQKRLTDEGLDVDGWHKLLAMSGTGDAGALMGESHETHAAVEQLAVLLNQLTANTAKVKMAAGSGSGQAAQQLTQDLKNVNSQIDTLTDRMQKRINDLVDVVASDIETVAQLEREASKKGLAPKLSRSHLLVILGEVVQELCQPLAVIMCSLQMVESQVLGEVAATQIEMIKLALDSARKMQTLAANLERIAGPPKTREPDRIIQDSLYEAKKPVA